MTGSRNCPGRVPDCRANHTEGPTAIGAESIRRYDKKTAAGAAGGAKMLSCCDVRDRRAVVDDVPRRLTM